MAASLLSLSSPAPSTATPHRHQLSSHFKGNARTLRAKPCPFPSVKLCHHKAKQRQPLVVLNSAASGVQESAASNLNVRFRLDNLGPQPGSRKKAKRKGRGHSAGQGGSCGFGMRGQKSRSGPGVRKGFEGGQMPLYRRIPKLRGIAGGKVIIHEDCEFSGMVGLKEVSWLILWVSVYLVHIQLGNVSLA